MSDRTGPWWLSPCAWRRRWGTCSVGVTCAAGLGGMFVNGSWGLTLGQWETLEGTLSPLRKNQAFPEKRALPSPVRWELVTKLCTDLPICLEQCFSNVLKQLDPLFFFFFLLIIMLSRALIYNRGKNDDGESQSPPSVPWSCSPGPFLPENSRSTGQKPQA